jgi:hypothetical protein
MWVSPSAGAGQSGSLSVFSGAFISEKIDGMGGKG